VAGGGRGRAVALRGLVGGVEKLPFKEYLLKDY
jgi:hypothetical protein